MGLVTTYGLTRAQVLQALYNPARATQLRETPEFADPLTDEQADAEISDSEHSLYSVDYVNGCPIWVNLWDEDRFDSWMYDGAYGAGAAQRAIDEYRQSLAN